MPSPGKKKSKAKAKRGADQTPPSRKRPASLKPPPFAPAGVDWAEEIELLFSDLAHEMCDTPDKCKMLVVRVTLRDGSEYLISGHGKRVVTHPTGWQEIVCMHFIGQDSRKRNVALSVRPGDILKIELVDVPEKEERPPFGFATRIPREKALATITS